MNARTRELFEAIADKNIAKVKAALTYNSVDLTVENSQKRTAIQAAAMSGFWEGVQIIAESAYDDDKQSKRYCDALSLAIKADFASKEQVVTSLLQNGAKQTKVFKLTLDSCHHIAIQKNEDRILKLLLEQDVAFSETNNDGFTPIELACKLGQTKCIDLLLTDKRMLMRCKTRENAEKIHIDQALIFAVEHNDYYVVKKLLETCNAVCTATDRRGNIALHFAITHKNAKMVALLLKHGANPSDENELGKTMIEVARQLNASTCVAAMQNPNSLTTNTPLSTIDVQLNDYLNELLQALSAKKFYIQNLFGVWIEGDPANVKAIKALLAAKNGNDSDNINKTFAAVLGILSHVPASTKRHPGTTQWYEDALQAINAVKSQAQLATIVGQPVYLMTQYNAELPAYTARGANTSALGLYGSTVSVPSAQVLAPVYLPTEQANFVFSN